MWKYFKEILLPFPLFPHPPNKSSKRILQVCWAQESQNLEAFQQNNNKKNFKIGNWSVSLDVKLKLQKSFKNGPQSKTKTHTKKLKSVLQVLAQRLVLSNQMKPKIIKLHCASIYEEITSFFFLFWSALSCCCLV